MKDRSFSIVSYQGEKRNGTFSVVGFMVSAIASLLLAQIALILHKITAKR